VRRGAGGAAWWRSEGRVEAEPGPPPDGAEGQVAPGRDRPGDEPANDDRGGQRLDPVEGAERQDPDREGDDDEDGGAEVAATDVEVGASGAEPGADAGDEPRARVMTHLGPSGLPEPGAAEELRAEARAVRSQAASDIRELRRMLREFAEQIRTRRDEAQAGARDLRARADAIDHAWAMLGARRRLEAEAERLELEAADAEAAAEVAAATLADAERRHDALLERLAEVPGERSRRRAELSQATTEARSLGELTGMRQTLAMLDAVVADLEAERDSVLAQITALGSELEHVQGRAAVARRRADGCRWQAQHDPLDEDIPPAPVAAAEAAAEPEDSAWSDAAFEPGLPADLDLERAAVVSGFADHEAAAPELDIDPALPAEREV